MKNPLRRTRKKIFLGGEGMKLLWKLFPHTGFFEVYVPAREKGEKPQLPLVLESTDARLIEPYSKMFYRLFTAREIPLFRILFMNTNCDPVIAHRIAANLAITLASEDIVTYLIDLDLQKPALHEVFHVERSPGMVDYLLKGMEPQGIVRETGIPELKFVPSGSAITDPGEIVSALAWRNTLEILIPPGIVSLIYAGRGDSFDMSELMKEIDGTILLISSGERINRWVRKELKRIKKRSDVVGVIWTNPMEYPFRRFEQPVFEEDPMHEGDREMITGTEGDEETDYPLIDEERLDLEDEGDTMTEHEGGEMEKTGEDDESLASREILTTITSRMNEVDSVNDEMKHEEGEHEGTEPDKDRIEPVSGEIEGPDWRSEKEESGKGEEEAWESEGEWGEDREIDPGDDEWDDGELNLFDDDYDRGRRKPIWIAFFGVLFVILIAWFLYESGLFTRDEQLQDIVTEGVGTEEVAPSDAVPDAEPGIAEETPPRVETGEMIEARTDFLSEGSATPYSLILGSFQQIESAEKGKEQLVRAGFDAYLVPVEIPGLGRWIRLMQGQYADREAALAMLDEVKRKGGITEGRVVESSLAYLMGGFNSRARAEQALDDIESKGLDGYILESDKEEKIYFLYLGAFENAEQSRYLSEIIEEKELSGSLVSRKGFRR